MSLSVEIESPRLWVADAEALRDGDVLLEYGGTGKSPLIARFDGGTYSHALMWVGNTDFVEAVGSGVRVISYRRIIIETPNNWILLRQNDSSLGQRAAIAARKFVGKRYDLLGAVGSKWPGTRMPDQELLFCSQLIAEAYLEAGLELVPGLASNNVTPRTLEECQVFKQSPVPLVQLSADDCASAQAYLDRDDAYQGSFMDREARAARKAFNAVKPLLTGLPEVLVPGVGVPPGNLHELTDVLRCVPISVAAPIADRLLSELISVNYFHLLESPIAEEVRDKIIRDGMALRYSALTDEQREMIKTELKAEYQSWGQTMERHHGNASVCYKEWTRTALPLWKELADMYRRNEHVFIVLRTLVEGALSEM